MRLSEVDDLNWNKIKHKKVEEVFFSNMVVVVAGLFVCIYLETQTHGALYV